MDEESLNVGRLALLITGGILALYIVLSSTVVVGAGKVGVVTQFGKVTGREMQPGLNIKLPSPFQGVWVADTRVQKEQASASAASTDLQDVTASLAVNYHLEHGKVGHIYSTIGVEYKSRIIDPAIQETFKASAAQYTAAELIQRRQEVKDKALKGLQDRLNNRGIIVDDLSIVNFNFSDAFNQAIEQKQVAQQQAAQAQFSLDKARLDAQAQEAQKVSLSGELLQKYAIDKWDGKMPTYVGGGSIFNIPLSK